MATEQFFTSDTIHFLEIYPLAMEMFLLKIQYNLQIYSSSIFKYSTLSGDLSDGYGKVSTKDTEPSSDTVCFLEIFIR